MANWNIDWTTRVGEPLLKASAADDAQYNFGRAVEERYFGGITFFSSGATGDRGLAFVTDPGSNDSGIAAAEAAAFTLQDKWLAPGYDPEGHRWFNTISFLGYDDSTRETDVQYRLQRRWRRRIWSTANAGTIGQRAIFEDHRPFILPDGSINTNGEWYAVDDTDAAFGTWVTTPDAQRRYSGKLFEHNGSAWVLASDQSTPADIVTQAESRRWYPGSIIHGADLNELRDRINDMVTSWAVADPDNDGAAASFGDGSMHRYSQPLSSTPPSSLAGTLGTTNGQSRTGSSNVSQAAADAAYNAASPTAGGTAGMKKSRFGTPPGAVSFSNDRMECEIFTNTAHLPDTGQNREVSYWVWAIGFDEFDSYGDGVADHGWHLLGSGTQTNKEVDSGADGVKAGDVTGTAPAPWPATTDTVRGWELKDVGITVNWEVSGGFAYVASGGF